MPELPDVEVFRTYLDATTLEQPVERVEVFDNRILEGTSKEDLRNALTGKRLHSTRRHGKHMFARYADDEWLVLYFGMTGYLAYLARHESQPNHTRVLFTFDNGNSLAFVCQRMLGRVSLASNLESSIADRDLGVDALGLNADDFARILNGRQGSIKSALTNQSLIAGLGNIYADEVLFQAGIRPDTRTRDLDDDDFIALHGQMLDVIRQAVESEVDVTRMPDTWLLPRRRRGEPCPKCGTEIEDLKLSGRTAYFCPNCQPER